MPPPGSAGPGRSTWNMAPDSAGMWLPLSTRAHGHGRGSPSDDPGAGRDRGPSEQTPGRGDRPRAGLASDGPGLRFHPSTSQPAERAALARRVAGGVRALVTPGLTLWQVLPVHGAAGEGELPARDMRVRVPRGTSRSGGGVAGALGGVAHAAGSRLVPTGGPTRATRVWGHPGCGRPTADGPSSRFLDRCVVCRTLTMDGGMPPPAPAPERPRPCTPYSLWERADCSV